MRSPVRKSIASMPIGMLTGARMFIGENSIASMLIGMLMGARVFTGKEQQCKHTEQAC